MSGKGRKKGWRNYTQRMRAKGRGYDCEFCGDRWEQAKTNYLQDSGVCLFCHQRLAAIMARGAAWALRRRATLEFWDRRLGSIVGAAARKNLKRAG